MTTLFGAIADDFTGATDLAALLARSGVRVSLRLGVPQEPPSATAPLEIIALKCRTSPAAEAISQTRSALAWLQGAGAKRFYWKYCSTFDSTPEGNIGPVAEALMADLGVASTIYCPAFPENGRSIYMGYLFVGEQPLAESPMKDHPLTPMRDSNLMRLLHPQVTRPVGLVSRATVSGGAVNIRNKLSELQGNGIAHIVVDAITNGDLQSIAEACQDIKLLTGGSALARQLPELWLRQGLLDKGAASDARASIDGKAIILSGSCSAMTMRQVSAYLKNGQPSFRIDPVRVAKEGVEPLLAWLHRQPSGSAPLVYATAEAGEVKAAQSELGTVQAGELVEKALGACAVAARELGTRRFVVAGGETSGAVAKALQLSRLEVGKEITPGVPWCLARSEGYFVEIALKSGNFGGETFFTDALELKP